MHGALSGCTDSNYRHSIQTIPTVDVKILHLTIWRPDRLLCCRQMHATQAKYELISKIFAERIERDGLLMKDHLAREDHFDERWCAATPRPVPALLVVVVPVAAAFCRLLAARVLLRILVCWSSLDGCGLR